MHFPDFPKHNDTIGICAPSAGVGYKIESFNKSIDALRSAGLRTVETKNVRNDSEPSAPAHIRGEEFNSLIIEKKIKAIVSASGGDYNIEMLPYIDEQAIIDNPKWIVGASDPTNILYYVTTKLDIATIYGFNAGTFDWRPLPAFQKNSLKILMGNLIEQYSFETYDSLHNTSQDEFKGDANVKWDVITNDSHSNSSFSNSIDITGRLIGGCTDVIANLIGTPYDGTAEFVSRYDDIIWYLDTFQMSANSLYRTLLQMKYCGYFEKIKAIIFGRVMYQESTDLEYIDTLKKIFDVPIIFGADIGHVKPSMTFINGSTIRLKCYDGKGSIETYLR